MQAPRVGTGARGGRGVGGGRGGRRRPWPRNERGGGRRT